ncbi:malonyl-CoA:anthocyanidin 5-O-glucoside-6''-O-malonyltransferase-like [Dorcoceras hygrometricum]|uniref:Malonyl-CoA:anthocyanidin 5-O-glucoside-6''-O-malonyltransferase-like n=1 Tax=Dorcoceras hygrometricum TaxID=472368 RepID=A0A2Z6ZQQ3_9LAMI|nr:malonyl-CoA:anthocyanidin 5-O-glucoside-6''-O-malonyltransferase-like [Dorcoceras hygrometricum]
MQIDSDLVIYRTTLVRTFQVVTICRVDKSEASGLGETPMHVGAHAPPPPPTIFAGNCSGLVFRGVFVRADLVSASSAA